MAKDTFKGSRELTFTIEQKTFHVGVYPLAVDNSPRLMLWHDGEVKAESGALTEALVNDRGGVNKVAENFIGDANKALERILGEPNIDDDDKNAVWARVLKFLGEHLEVADERFVIR